MSEQPSTTVDHWWWRPGWRQGRSFYTWHIVFGDSAPAVDLAGKFAALVAELPTMDEVGSDGLHVTVQGVGFTDQVAKPDLDRIVSAARVALAAVSAEEITFGPPYVDAETIQLGVRDAAPLATVRSALQSAIGSVWGEREIPERAAEFTPHLTVAYSNGAAAVSRIEERLRTHGLADSTFRLPMDAVSLIELNRDRKRYEWTESASVPLAHRPMASPDA